MSLTITGKFSLRCSFGTPRPEILSTLHKDDVKGVVNDQKLDSGFAFYTGFLRKIHA